MKKLRIRKRINKRKLIIIVLNVLLLVIGLLYPSIINKASITTKLTNYIDNLINIKYTIESLIKTNILNNISETILLSLNTILVISFPISIIIFLLKPFTLGVSISSIIYIYKLKGILYTLIIIIPSLLNLLLINILYYYSISYILIRIKYKNKRSRKRLLIEYIKVLVIILVLNIILSFIDSYLSFYLFKFLK